MDMKKEILKSRGAAEVLLAALITARATSYMFSKLLLETMGQFTLLGLRSLLAFAVLLAISFKYLKATKKEDVTYGILVGACLFTVMCLELSGLKHTSSVSVSFEENMAVIFVPILLAVINRKLPSWKTVAAVSMSAVGIALLKLNPEGFDFNIGDLYGILSAVAYAATIILISRIGGKGDPLRIGIYQVGTIGVLAMAAAFIFETPALPAAGMEWGYLLYLAIVCSVFGFTLQPYAQSRTTAERAGMLCALNPVTAAVLGMVFLGETMTAKGILGAVLIVAGILL
jgi:drug/metabolite transporter (DMT)-like permease